MALFATCVAGFAAHLLDHFGALLDFVAFFVAFVAGLGPLLYRFHLVLAVSFDMALLVAVEAPSGVYGSASTLFAVEITFFA